jgi:sugar/nucleoside kinase (ribokinase family)
VTKLAPVDRPLFAPVLEAPRISVTALPAKTTSAFGLRYTGDERVLTVDAIGDPWIVADLDAAMIETSWVHLAPLLRSDFPVDVIETIAARGHQVSYDGQGLVRRPELGPLLVDAAYDTNLLSAVSVLKLNDEEAEAVAGGPFGLDAARRLGIPEIIVTLGSHGCILYVGGEAVRVPAARAVGGVHATGAGDLFMVAYLKARAGGIQPVPGAEQASEFVAATLEARRASVKLSSSAP